MHAGGAAPVRSLMAAVRVSDRSVFDSRGGRIAWMEAAVGPREENARSRDRARYRRAPRPDRDQRRCRHPGLGTRAGPEDPGGLALQAARGMARKGSLATNPTERPPIASRSPRCRMPNRSTRSPRGSAWLGGRGVGVRRLDTPARFGRRLLGRSPHAESGSALMSGGDGRS